jgi:hypothetical protein
MPNWLANCHPDIRLVLGYWQEKCAGRLMPTRADIDPAEIRRFLPHITLVDVVADERRFVYRLVGTSEVELRGYDPTGRPVAEAYFAATAEEALKIYERVKSTREPFYIADPYQTVDRFVGEEDLFLPLSQDGETVSMILVFSVSRDLFAPAVIRGED